MLTQDIRSTFINLKCKSILQKDIELFIGDCQSLRHNKKQDIGPDWNEVPNRNTVSIRALYRARVTMKFNNAASISQWNITKAGKVNV